ncbi:putative peptidoglycan glycosyltransferase FtsW [Acaryochloris sp. IP29b_bin.137]|uniref:FtsW/RodA/SpoVE family cell cycle protein n=1 Tax=Acaryochloris sp. IP29b_bin.137 TaxID=2969217 RepID=UPI002602BD52|nr:putative peptidoglycan glycosyltransferase FtsW [Acaryochloris sp. IP29b_bin.137]
MKIRRLIPSPPYSTEEWAAEARFLHWLTLFWLGIGLVVLFSASYHAGAVEFGDGFYYSKRQLLGVVLGLLGFCAVIHIRLQRLMNLSALGFFLCLVLIFATKIPGLGMTINGATRWIDIGPFPLQPSELIKPFLILQSAYIFNRWPRLTLGERLGWLFLFLLTLLGILIQPNLSTTALCGMTLWLIALAAGLRYRSLLVTALAGIGLAAISVLRNPYQQSRILSFLSPWDDPLGDGFQLHQSLLAVGSGGLLGTGFGESQLKLSYLPIQHTDFIFAVFAEEFGLLGGFCFLLLLATYSFLALRVAMKSTHAIQRLVAIGAMIFLIGQSLINIGVVIGVLPTTGLPLPMFSYGGNSMISSLLIAGLLIRSARESQNAEVVAIPHHEGESPSLIRLVGDHASVATSRHRTPATGLKGSSADLPSTDRPPLKLVRRPQKSSIWKRMMAKLRSSRRTISAPTKRTDPRAVLAAKKQQLKQRRNSRFR